MGKLEDTEGELLVACEKRLKEALKLHNLGSIADPVLEIELPWHMLPAELRPGPQGKRVRKATKNAKPNLVKRSKDVASTLEELEKKEVAKEEGAASDDEKPDNKEADDNDEEEEKKADEVEEEDADEPDEEMDGGTDYANQYFDNGEDYLDEEDDALEEGGVF